MKVKGFYLVFLLSVSAVFCLNADENIEVSAAVKLTFPTKKGVIYQLEVKRQGKWQKSGLAFKGDGEKFEGLRPTGEYRLSQPKSQWLKVWADEFDKKGGDIDYSKWAKEENNYGGGNNERQAYRIDKKYCFIKDGKLNIAVYRDSHTTNDGKTQPYSSARIRTMKRGDWVYGKFEIRAKMPKGQGIWPAVWMLPTDSKYGGWAAGGEIDIIESRGSAVGETTGALHFGGPWPRNTYLSHAYKFPGKNAAEDFHIYTLEWNKDEIKWFIDGKKVKGRSKKEWFSESARDNPSAPFDQPFHIIVNVAVDGRFFNNTKQKADLIPNDQFPQVLEIDYIRVYQWAE